MLHSYLSLPQLIFFQFYLGWQFNTWSDIAVYLILLNLLFILSWAINKLIFVCWLYLKIKHCCFFICKFWIYSTVFTPHIYFVIFISMIAGNLVEIRLPKIHVQSRKCLRKSNLWRYSRKCLRKFTFQRDKIAGVISLPLASTQRIFSFHNVWNVIFRLSISYFWPFVSCVF